MKKMKKQERKRNFIQLIAAVLMNGYLIGYAKGKIFTGDSKIICVPVLNCYSCPGAVGSCPIGAIQSVSSGRGHRFSFYVLGLLMAFGIILGRTACGFLCPFGFFQDILHKIPLSKLKIPQKADKCLRYLKYGVLIFTVLLLPALFRDEFGLGVTYFCKYICPAGTLGAGFPLVAADKSLRNILGGLFFLKLGILVFFVILSIFMFRPFCKYVCPLGAFYALFNKYSFFRHTVDKEKCIDCKRCETVCPMQVDVIRDISGTECINCGKCAAACPTDAIYRLGFPKKK